MPHRPTLWHCQLLITVTELSATPQGVPCGPVAHLNYLIPDCPPTSMVNLTLRILCTSFSKSSERGTLRRIWKPGPHFVAMSLLGYSVPPELAFSTLGRPSWADQIPNIYASRLARLEIEPLVACWRTPVLKYKLTATDASHPFPEESWRDKTRIAPPQAAVLRLLFFAMRKPRACERANLALLKFRPTEVLVNRAVDRYKEYLLTVPSAPNARKGHIDKIRKLGRLLWANLGVLDMSWQDFLRAQCVIERDDLD